MHPESSVVEVRNVSKRFGSVQALSDVDFALRGPQLLGILGPNGAGKTTLLDLLEGRTPERSGCSAQRSAPIRAAAWVW
jgi:ABC-type multidrug transport system ATPase subunit